MSLGQSRLEMPANIIYFERIAYCALALMLLSLVVDQTTYQLRIVHVLLPVIVVSIPWGALIWVTARRRRNWGRWIYGMLAVSAAIRTAWTLGVMARLEFISFLVDPSQALFSLAIFLQAVATYYAFSRNAGVWFVQSR